MREADKHEFSLDRPPFMEVLGLLPPYELADVKAAYRDKVFSAHPDQGGDPAEFVILKEAYDNAVEYATFHSSRRGWIAAQMETYLHQEAMIAEVLERGGRVEIQTFDWMERSLGDGFPHLAERLRYIYVRDMADGDAFMALLTEHRLPYLVGLDVAGSRISGEGLGRLAGAEVLRKLDVSGTDVDFEAVQSVLNSLPSLEWLNVRDTSVGWWGRWQLMRTHPRLQVVTEVSPPIEPGNVALNSRD